MGTYIEIQDEVIKKYGIRIDSHSSCRGRMHAHVRERRICKWVQKNSVRCTFDLFHEIGHIESNRRDMRRAEEEFYATCWAIDRFREYGLAIPENVLHVYRRYVLLEVARGRRRGGSGYGSLNLYRYAGINKSIEQFKAEIEPRWAAYINAWV